MKCHSWRIECFVTRSRRFARLFNKTKYVMMQNYLLLLQRHNICNEYAQMLYHATNI